MSYYWEKRSPKWRRRIFEKTDLDYLIRAKEQELLAIIKKNEKGNSQSRKLVESR